MSALFSMMEVTSVAATAKTQELKAKTLRGAKISASRLKFFQGTTLKFVSQNGRILSVKEPGEKWLNY